MEAITEKISDLAFEARSRELAGTELGGADTVEYVIVLVLAVVIGAALFGIITGSIKPAITNVGSKITTWFNNAV